MRTSIFSWILALACLTALTACSMHAHNGTCSGGAISYRLPSLATPSIYRLRIEPDLERSTFQGEESILLSARQQTSKIVLNAVDLNLTSASIVGPENKQPRSAHITLAKESEQAKLSFDQPLKPGQYELRISFNGALNDKLRGFYRSTYKDDHGIKQPLAATQMEPTDARRMFPCFDEPHYKAAYQITAVIPPDLVALSNASVASEKIDPSSGKKVVVFAQSPKMSTYLVALIIGHLESTAPFKVGSVPIRVWTRPGKSKLGLYAGKIAAQLLPYYTSYFGTPYPASKLDLIALPDFEAGAMENLGAITFRESALLAEPTGSSTATLQRVAGVVAHEMAHLWFGDLVTMQWWDDLWLNEAFATWMSVKATDHLMPAWHCWDEFGLSRSLALSTDSLQSTEPIHFKVENPQQINEMFNEITYSKGASVLRMLERYVGEKIFAAGVQRYIKQYRYSNATTENLWEAIGAVSHSSIPELMHNWVYQPGYPLITATAEGRSINLSQKRFLLDTTGDEVARSNRANQEAGSWNVPLAIKVLNKPSQQSVQLLKSSAPHQVACAVSLGNAVFIANAGADGFYRVRYTDAMLHRLAPLIESALSPAERLGLLSDLWALTLAGDLPIGNYLQLTDSYQCEPDPAVCETLLEQFDQLNNFVDKSCRTGFEKLIKDRLSAIHKRLGWDAQPGESDSTHLLRAEVLETLGTIGQDKPTIARARQLFSCHMSSTVTQKPAVTPDADKRHTVKPGVPVRGKKYSSDSSGHHKEAAKVEAISPNLLEAITNIVAYNGGESEYKSIKHLWQDAKTPEGEQRNLLALALFRQPEQIKDTLQLSLSDQVRSQDAPHLLSELLMSDASKELTWQFIKAHWSELTVKLPQNMVPRIMRAASSLDTAGDEQDLQSFFACHRLPSGEQTVARLLERVHILVRFRTSRSAAMRNWLKKLQ